MPRVCKTKVVIETRMPDGGWVELPETKRENFKTIPEAELYVKSCLGANMVWRIAKVTGEYYIKQFLVKR